MSPSARSMHSATDHGCVVAFWIVVVVHPHNDGSRCCASPPPGHCRSTTAVCCGTGGASASGPATVRPAAGRSRESDAILLRRDVSGSRLKALLALCAAQPTVHPAVGTTALPGGAHHVP